MFRGVWLLFLLLALWLVMSPSAFYPAMAGQHCGAQGDWRSNLVPDYWPPKGVKTSWIPGGNTIRQVPVYKACVRHDECYDRLGATQAQCDRRFLVDMRDQCKRVYKDVLQMAHLEACKTAAQGYYQAVAKYGGPAFAQAQAKQRAAGPDKAMSPKTAKNSGPKVNQARMGGKGQTRPKNSAAVQGGVDKTASPEATRPKWEPWGELAGVTGLAAIHGTLYAYKAGTSEIFSSPAKRCAWKRVGVAPIGKCFTGGQGYLYLSGVLGDQIWNMRPGVKPWVELAEAKGLSALAAGGGKLIGWFTPQGALRSSNPSSVGWRDLGRVKQVLSLTWGSGKIYCLSKPGLQISWRRKNQNKWNLLGRAPAAGCLAMDKETLFLAMPETGRIMRAPAH
ncbi:MAG: phospholipase [Deltaproteobacteria bacterium]|nr:phospholipase [Deltaproteobacteria bacterium]